jgi:hypothetical protein
MRVIIGKTARKFFLYAPPSPNRSSYGPGVGNRLSCFVRRIVDCQSTGNMFDGVPCRYDLKLLDRWILDAGDEALQPTDPNGHFKCRPNRPLHDRAIAFQFVTQGIFTELLPGAGAKRPTNRGKGYPHSRHDRRSQHVRASSKVSIAARKERNGFVGSNLTVVNPVRQAPDRIERPRTQIRASFRVLREQALHSFSARVPKMAHLTPLCR